MVKHHIMQECLTLDEEIINKLGEIKIQSDEVNLSSKLLKERR